MFCRDASITLFTFALHPLYYLFLGASQLYKVIVSLCLFSRGLIPSKNEVVHTYLHWQFWIIIFILNKIRQFIRLNIVLAIKLACRLENINNSILLHLKK